MLETEHTLTMSEETLLRTIFAAKVREVKEGGEGGLMVCAS